MNKLYKKTKDIIKKHDLLFVIFYNLRAYSLYFFNLISNYNIERKRFYKRLNYTLNLENPKSFNEKIIWKKINDRNPLLPVVADKYQVRSYIKRILGEEEANEILIPLLFITDKPQKIPFETLPVPFIIKPNHASGLNIIVKNDDFNKTEIINTCLKWLRLPYCLERLEWAYQHIRRKIIIEKLLLEKNKIPKDIKFHMFHGKCCLIHVEFDRFGDRSKTLLTPEWKILDVAHNMKKGPFLEPPENLSKMISISEKLAKSFDYIRVDFYSINEKIYIGELTNYQSSGTGKFEPQSFDFELGKYWRIQSGYWKIN